MDELIGKKIGRLNVLELLPIKGKGKIYRCKCECGNYIDVVRGQLLQGRKSCGCLLREFRESLHGLQGTRFYRKYNGIKQRCNNENSDAYKWYGGKGIKCERRTFEEYYKDMYKSYLEHCEEYGEDNTSIDRIDSNGNYCKENCRWVCNREQHINTSRNRIYEYGGEKMCATDWARKLGYKDRSFLAKLDNGIPIAFIIEQPGKRYCAKWHEKYPPKEKKLYAITKIEKNKEYMKEYREKNKDKIREYRNQYQKKYRDHEYYKKEYQRQKEKKLATFTEL